MTFSTEDMARTMMRATADPENRARMSQRGKTAVARFDTGIFGERSVRHIRELRNRTAGKKASGAGAHLIRELVLGL